jgi:hypothetical protein
VTKTTELAYSLVRPVADIAVGAACLGLLLSVLAVWLDRLRAVREQAWHDQFELPFAEYVRERRPGTGS